MSFSQECELDILEKLRTAADNVMSGSLAHIPNLRGVASDGFSLLQLNPSATNQVPKRTLKEGVDYLNYAYRLVEVYKDCVPGPISDAHIQSVNDTLKTLEFDSTRGKKPKPKYHKLLYSESKNDLGSFIKLVERNIDKPVKKFFKRIDPKFQSALSEKLLEAIKDNNVWEVENCIRRGVIVDFNGPDGRTPLHRAVYQGNVDIVKNLLKNGAKVTETLYIACSKGHTEMIDLLLEHVSVDEKIDFINAKTSSGTTSLHVAAENGFFDIVKCLLKHGGIYNIENTKGQTPMDSSQDEEIVKFLESVDNIFQDIENGHFATIGNDVVSIMKNARNKQGKTVLLVAINNGHKKIASQLLQMLQKIPDRSKFNLECELDQLENLKKASEKHLITSEQYLPYLLGISEPFGLPKNPVPWKTVEKGSMYLSSAMYLIELYQKCVPGWRGNKSIKSIRDMLIGKLGFVGIPMTSLGELDREETYYYKLLHSDWNRDVRLFVKLVETEIDKPVRELLELINEKYIFQELIKAIRCNNNVRVESLIKKEISMVNFKDPDGRTPLHHAVDKGNLNIVSSLLKHGAKVEEITNRDNTVLHIACSKGYTQIVEVLLRYASGDKSNGFVDAKTSSGGTTSLHVAAKNGFFGIVKCLLRHGATFNIWNKEGKIPVDVGKDEDVVKFLQSIEELFEDVTNCCGEAIDRLRALKPCEFASVINARCNDGRNLLQYAIDNGFNDFVRILLEMILKDSG